MVFEYHTPTQRAHANIHGVRNEPVPLLSANENFVGKLIPSTRGEYKYQAVANQSSDFGLKLKII